MRTILKGSGGFTLVELVIVIVVIGILAAIAIPKFTDLSDTAKIAATEATAGAVRSVVSAQLLKNSGAYPDNITADMFADGLEPLNAISGRRGVLNVSQLPAPGEKNMVKGFWYVSPASSSDTSIIGRVGYYS